MAWRVTGISTDSVRIPDTAGPPVRVEPPEWGRKLLIDRSFQSRLVWYAF